MDTIRIASLQEKDFDAIIETAGGQRLDTPNNRMVGQTADYKIGHSIIELKLLKEEGLEKNERQKKLAELFVLNQPDRPVVVLSPNLLSDNERYEYYRIMETPIKSHVAKATKQLNESSKRYPDAQTTVLLLANVGYNSLDIDEFEDIARRKVIADTSHIDYMISAGIYFYGDNFDYYTLESFQLLPIDLKKTFPEFSAIKNAWQDYTKQIMTNVVTGNGSEAYDRGVVVDISFNINGVTFIKPSPKIGDTSKFYKYGRPRANSTGINECPPVGLIFPHLSLLDWAQASEELADPFYLEGSYNEYLRKEATEDKKNNQITKPFISFPVDYSEYALFVKEKGISADFASLCRYASTLFAQTVRTMCESAIDMHTSKIVPSKYIFLTTQEIGQDKAFDLSSAYLVEEIGASSRREVLFENLNMFFEYGLALASAYAIKYSVSVIVYHKDNRFKWE